MNPIVILSVAVLSLFTSIANAVPQAKLDLTPTEALLKKLKDHPPKGIEYIEAGPNSASIVSRWGHALLRFVDDDQDSFNDVTIGFVANIPASTTSNQMYTKGIAGSFEVTIEALPLSKIIQRYSNTEARSLRRAIIPATPKQLSDVVAFLTKFQRDKTFAGHYFYVGRNCAVLLQYLLKSVGLDHLMRYAQSPTWVIDLLEKQGSAPWPVMETLDVNSVYRDFAEELDMSSGNSSSAQLDADEFEKRVTAVSSDTLSRYFTVAREHLAKPVRLILLNEIVARNIKVSLDNIYDVKSAPVKLYQLCGDAACFTEQIKVATVFWSKEKVATHCGHLNKLDWTNIFGTPVSGRKAESLLCK